MMLPRPDLSGGGRDVVEFRIRAHDGERLWGLLARPTWHSGDRPARVHSVGPAHAPALDWQLTEDGYAELVFQEPAGRRLEDRVLDVLRIWKFATASQGIEGSHVALGAPQGPDTDELLIARGLLEGLLSETAAEPASDA